MNNKKLLEKAFNESFELVAGKLDGEVQYDVLETAMKTFAKKEAVTFTDEEIRDAITEGIKTMKAAGFDFSFQSKMML